MGIITLEEKIVTYMGRYINLWKDVKFIKNSEGISIDILEWNLTDKAKPTRDELNSINVFIDPCIEKIERLKRDQLISETDWTQMDDSPLSIDSKAMYKEYRRQLRDITNQDGFPTNINWPEINVK